MSLGTLIPRRRTWHVAAPTGDFDRLFGDLWSGFGRGAMVAPASRFVPRIDASETDEAYRVTAELPGLEKDDFSVMLDEDVLTIKGEKRSTHDEEVDGVRHVESGHGSFERRFRFPKPIAVDAVDAVYENGVLTVTLPKPEEDRPQARTIPVTMANS